MKKLAVLCSICLSVLVLSACKPKTVEISTQEEQEPVAAGQSTDTFVGSVTDLLQEGKSLVCSFEHSDEQNSTKGQVYVDGERMRGDFEMKQSDEETQLASVIRKDDYNYIWGDLYETGIKSKITEPEEIDVEVDETEAPEEESDFNYDQEFEYSCDEWFVDEAQFDLPEGIEFIDISEQIEQIMNSTEMLDQVSCDTCASLPDDAKDACLQALDCE